MARLLVGIPPVHAYAARVLSLERSGHMVTSDQVVEERAGLAPVGARLEGVANATRPM